MCSGSPAASEYKENPFPCLQKVFYFFALLRVLPFHKEGILHADTYGIIFIYTFFDWKMSQLYFKGIGNTRRKKKAGTNPTLIANTINDTQAHTQKGN